MWLQNILLLSAQTRTFNTIVWEETTENLGAAPSASNPFEPIAGQDYYWKVTPANEFNQELNHTSQVWRARFNPSLWVNDTYKTPGTAAPALLRPKHGYELVEMTPVMEWKPVQGATAYEVQVSWDAAFTQIVLSEEVTYPVYAPTSALAQRNLELFDYGTYYWRVRALNNGVPLSGGWSAGNRFQIASQATWVFSRGLGDFKNRLEVAADPAADVSAINDLTALNISQDKDYWYVGFPVNATTADADFLIYLDLDHMDGSGATTDPIGAGITSISAHQPEYVIHVDETNQEYTPENTDIYAWNQDSGAYHAYQNSEQCRGRPLFARPVWRGV